MSAPDPFAVLGVEPETSGEEIESAYKRLAQIYHPDRYATAPVEVQAEAARRMAGLNAARDAIKSGFRRQGTFQSAAEEAAREAYAAASAYVGPHCSICGHAPVADLEFKVGVGKLFSRELRTWSGPLCRDCGEAIYRDSQNETMLKGWWGIISFFANLYYVYSNWVQRGKFNSLAVPAPTPKSLLTLADHPLPPGPPLVQRAGIWVAVVFLGLVSFWVLGSLTQAGYGPGSSMDEEARFRGTCWTEAGSGDLGDQVACTSGAAAFRIIDVVASEQDCPTATDVYFVNGAVWCGIVLP